MNKTVPPPRTENPSAASITPLDFERVLKGLLQVPAAKKKKLSRAQERRPAHVRDEKTSRLGSSTA